MFWKRFAAILAVWLCLSLPAWADDYQFQSKHDSDGIGKFYMGREIAQVMGHQGAGWLERSSRSSEEQPGKAIAALQLKSDSVVADIGAGTGYFSFRIASQVAKVYAVDVQPEMIEILNDLKAEKKISNVEPILGSETNPNLPENSVDLALMVDAYHEFEYPKEMMAGIVRSLKPHGRVVLLEYRGENPFVFIKPLHKMTQKQVRQEMTVAGLNYVETRNSLPQQHILIFEKAG
ncbi:class I SAM-dependent methyltransferase [Pseudanabaenaceae cyanobacterium LEGE 13415]|nr:class I SAM-dependent methyltransferase [Pseudanabaenaceae cyanobacterium LEGE 13415]